jgi:hypothetical protein
LTRREDQDEPQMNPPSREAWRASCRYTQIDFLRPPSLRYSLAFHSSPFTTSPSAVRIVFVSIRGPFFVLFAPFCGYSRFPKRRPRYLSRRRLGEGGSEAALHGWRRLYQAACMGHRPLSAYLCVHFTPENFGATVGFHPLLVSIRVQSRSILS